MSDIKIFNHSLPEIGYIARTTTKGNEFDMVNQYIEYTAKKYEHLKRKKAAIFIEPQIETGYPDIVIVEYLDPSNDLWDGNRNKLSTTDLKILFEIQIQKNVSIKNLSGILGFSLAEIKKSIHSLSRCGLIYLSKSQEHVRNVKLHSYCHISKIISIEAKIDKWSEAIRQAAMM